MPGQPDTSLASMGIYVFDADYLYRLLAEDMADPTSSHDFGKDVDPARGGRRPRGGAPVRHELHHQSERRDAVLARRRHDRRVLVGQPRPGRRSTPSSTSTTPTGRSGPTSASCRRPSSSPTTTACTAWRSTPSCRAAASSRARTSPVGAVHQRARAFVLPASIRRCCCPASTSARRCRLRKVVDRPRLQASPKAWWSAKTRSSTRADSSAPRTASC